VIRGDNPLSWQIIDSFLAGTGDWKTIGHSPSQDSYLSQYGGILRERRDRIDAPLGSPTDQTFVTNPPMKGGYTVTIEKPGPQILLAIPSAARLATLSLAPRMLVSIYGTNLAGSVVTMNSRSLPVNYADDNQINTLLPADASGLAKLTVSSTQGSQTVNIFVEPAAPAIFTRDGSGTGTAAAIRDGAHLSLYLTGLGVDPTRPSVFLDGQTLPVTYSGPAPGFTGLDQINVELPSALATGSVIVTVGRQASNAVTIPAP
jgi:uncharacterized protein (TIGR03437 family)